MSDAKGSNKTPGMFEKGGPGGPGRRRKRLTEDVEHYLIDALNIQGARMLVQAMTSATKLCGKDAVEHPDWPTRVHTFEVIRDTVLGRPAQIVTGEDGPLNMGVLIMPLEDAKG